MPEPAPVSITISSHNVNGFVGSKEFLHSRCDASDNAIFAIQEHWLKPTFRKKQGVNQLRSVHPRYDGYGTSAMNEKISAGVTKGRPFGGTGFIFSKSLDYAITCLYEYKHDRVSVLKLTTADSEILIINAYMPFFDTRNLNDQLLLYHETVGYLDYIMTSNPGCEFILTMDMNCNVYDLNHPYTQIIKDLVMKFSLISAFDLNPNFDHANSFTRCDIKNNSFTLIDGILVSSSLSTKISNVNINHCGNNPSDHSPVDLSLDVICSTFSPTPRKYTHFIPWNSLSNEEVSRYEQIMEKNLDKIVIPRSVLHGSSPCRNDDHCHALETYYIQILNAISEADCSLPRKQHGNNSSFWTPELSDLKKRSIESCDLWKLAGCPKSGLLFHEKCRTRMEYRAAIRHAKRNFDAEKVDSLYNDLSSRNNDSFWRRYNAMNGDNSNVNRIDGFIDNTHIANSFKKTFSKVYSSVDEESSKNLTSRFHCSYQTYSNLHSHDDLGPFYFSWADMLSALSKIKLGKATADFVRGQHILLGSPKLAIHLNILYNGLLQHSYIPQDFLNSTITPVVKDRSGNIYDSGNYRPIALSNIFSQLLEHLILGKIDGLLVTDELQFGFKRGQSTSHALFVLKSCVEYFTTHNSNVFVTYLDCTKAFDKMSHHGLFLKLIERNVPLCYVDILIYWYSNMQSRCRWENELSNSFSVPAGVKQGGVLSPRLFAVYIDDLMKRLRKKGFGCHIINIFVAAILFADDLCLMAPSRNAMQKMLNICQEYCAEYCLNFNTKKSKSMIIGKGHDSTPHPLFLNEDSIEYVREWKYLGALVVAGKTFSLSPRNDLCNFYSSFNTLINSRTRPSETVLMRLLYSVCVPNLTYAADVKHYSTTDQHKCTMALNNAIRKIFTFHRWESIRDFRNGLGYPDLCTLFAKRSRSFHLKLTKSRNTVIKQLLKLP